MWFKNYKLYLDDKDTGRLSIKYVCSKCDKEMDNPLHYRIPCGEAGIPLYHLAEFMCDECKNNDKEK